MNCFGLLTDNMTVSLTFSQIFNLSRKFIKLTENLGVGLLSGMGLDLTQYGMLVL